MNTGQKLELMIWWGMMFMLVPVLMLMTELGELAAGGVPNILMFELGGLTFGCGMAVLMIAGWKAHKIV